MKRFKIILFIWIFMVAIAGITLAGRVATPTEPPEGVRIISAIKAKLLVKKNEVRVFDMRETLDYGKGHIPGAASLPYKWTKKGHPSQRTGKFDIAKLPSDKNSKIIIHSEGPNGWKSYYASKAAKDAGYKNVMWLREGFSTWSDKGYSVVINNNSRENI